MRDWIVAKFPKNYERLHYIEPFAGALNVLFHKRRSELESVSDVNRNLYYFYKCLRDRWEELSHLARNTIFCEGTLKEALDFWKTEDAPEIKKAWASFVIFNCSFMGNASSFGYGADPDQQNNAPRIFRGKKEMIFDFHKRIESVQIFDRDAQWFLERFHKEEKVLMYMDPPYPETCQQFYSGFSVDDFNEILDKLYSAKFKFLISFYEKPSMELDRFKNESRFVFYKKIMRQTSLNENGVREEVLLCNFKNSSLQAELF